MRTKPWFLYTKGLGSNDCNDIGIFKQFINLRFYCGKLKFKLWLSRILTMFCFKKLKLIRLKLCIKVKIKLENGFDKNVVYNKLNLKLIDI